MSDRNIPVKHILATAKRAIGGWLSGNGFPSQDMKGEEVHQMSDRNIPVKYILYSHYAYNEGGDFDDYYTNNISLGELKGIRHLLEHLRGLKQLLITPGYEGMLVLFYSPGYARFLQGLARGRSNEDILSISDDHPKREEQRKQLRIAKEIASYVEKQLQQEGLEKRVRFLTSLDLDVILGRVNDSFAGQFGRFLLGEAAGLRYDSPKVIESILRLRILGHGVPVLRLDHDVIFRGANKDIDALDLSKSVASAVDAYKLRLDAPTVSSFLFSASYDSDKLLGGTIGDETERFDAWSRAFATRIFPALVVNPEEIKEICTIPDKQARWDKYVKEQDLNEELAEKFYKLSDKEKDHEITNTKWDKYVKEQDLNGELAEKFCKLSDKLSDKEKEQEITNAKWDKYVVKHLDEELARKFYGLEAGTGLKPDGTQGLTSIGAHPLYAVVSGALLCLSESAILDLPPFSNLGINVMWIDDHLKYSLHRALNHFTSGETLTITQPEQQGLRNARLDNVSVIKARPPASDIHTYIFGTYLPTLLWGAIMDAWITTDPILKCRFDTLDADKQEKWRAARDKEDQAPLPRAMLEALRIGRFDNKSKLELREALEKSAVDRIGEVRKLWAGLNTETEGTFASYWASGIVEREFGADLFGKNASPLWKGIAPGLSPEERINVLDDIPNLGQKVDNLISDTISYVDWTLEWPKFVQIVRSIRQGEFKGDLTWRS